MPVPLGLTDLAQLARDLDTQRATGTLSTADHTRLIHDIERTLEHRNQTWEQLHAVRTPDANQTTGVAGQLSIDSHEHPQ